MKPEIQKELDEALEQKSWICETCTTMTEPDQRYCLHCRLYWEDVAAGMFNDDWELDLD